MRDEEHVWVMFAVASLAGGSSASQAVKNADQLRDAAKSRFPKPDLDEEGD